jgi:hypothetical protein
MFERGFDPTSITPKCVDMEKGDFKLIRTLITFRWGGSKKVCSWYKGSMRNISISLD